MKKGFEKKGRMKGIEEEGDEEEEGIEEEE